MEKRLTADLNVVANSNLEIQLLDGDLNIIQKLDDEPNDVGGLTSAELKAKFDESGNIIKKYINETLIPSVLTDDATEESRKQAEAARVAAEQGRVTAEASRVTAEQGRTSAESIRVQDEQKRVSAENSRVEAEAQRAAAEQARADENTGIVAQATAQANAAAGSAESASASAQTAQSAASTASSAAAAASGFASQASAAAASAAQSAASVDGINKTAQSWAVGGTGTRPGEDTDNAKYWAKQAQAVVGGDFATKVEAQGYVTEHNQSDAAHPDLRVAVAGSVRYDAAQSLTDEQKAQARTNIGADTVQGAVLYTPQTLSDDQKAQARGNINAAPGGFGLGGTAKFLTADDDLNNVLTTGWYVWSWNAHPKNAPDNNWREYGCAMHVFATAPGGYAIQTVYDLSDDITHGCAIQRTIYVLSSGNVYYPWEWVNPPMNAEGQYANYRTIERYKGEAVFKGRLGDFEVWQSGQSFDNNRWASSGKAMSYGVEAGETKNITLINDQTFFASWSDNVRQGLVVVQTGSTKVLAITNVVAPQNWKIKIGTGLSVNVTELGGQWGGALSVFMI